MTGARPRSGVGPLVATNVLWLGIQFQDAALLAIVVPAILLRLDPAHHTTALSVLAALAAVVATLAPPVAGAFSDRDARRGVDRRTVVALWMVLDALALVAMAWSATVSGVTIALLLATLALNAAMAIFQALLPEVIPRASWGVASGIRGAMTLLGTIAGLAAAAIFPTATALLLTAGCITVTTLSLALIPSRPLERRERAKVRDRHDLFVTMVARGWITLGLTLFNTYVLYFFTDVLHVRSAPGNTALVAAAALGGAVISSIVAGIVSDRVDRRVVVFLGGIPMTIAALGFALLPSLSTIYFFAVLFGLGFGAVFSVGWALALDAIPELGDVARDLGAWFSLSNLPSIVAPVIGGFVLARVTEPREGYRLLFGLAALSFAFGSITVLGVGRRTHRFAAAQVLLTSIVRQAYLPLRVRIRSWGALPRRRGGTLLVANHQHEDESEIVIERTFLRSRWNAPVFTASSRRMWEPGFFAARQPWLHALLYRMKTGFLFEAHGMLPLENMLSSRPLRSLAHAVGERHGDVALDAVLDAETLRALPGAPATTAELESPRYAAAARTVVKLAKLREPYRTEALDATRASVEADLARFERLVRDGHTFFVTPEGTYSVDGRMLPLRGILARLAPVADVWLAAIAFDPFRGRRLSMLYRVVRPADPADLATSLAAARPVTASAVLAAWLVASDGAASAGEAARAVTDAVAALPATLFVDPELRRDPAAAAREALANVAARRRDRRFPQVADMVAYQAAFHAETLGAAEKLARRP